MTSTGYCLGYSFCGLFFFFFTATATTEIYTLSLHDALPILCPLPPHELSGCILPSTLTRNIPVHRVTAWKDTARSEEHTSELQSHSDLVCRLLLEKKKKLNPQSRLLLAQIPTRDNSLLHICY